MEELLTHILWQIVQYVVGAIMAGLCGYIKLQRETIKIKEAAEKRQDEKIQLLMDMAHASAQERILYLSAHYQKEKWVSVEDFKVFMNMVEKYEKLGKNGVVNAAVAKVQALPNVEPEV